MTMTLGIKKYFLILLILEEEFRSIESKNEFVDFIYLNDLPFKYIGI